MDNRWHLQIAQRWVEHYNFYAPLIAGLLQPFFGDSKLQPENALNWTGSTSGWLMTWNKLVDAVSLNAG